MKRSPNPRGRDADDHVEELSFDDDTAIPPRTGDPRVDAGSADPEISPRRAREAGRTGGELNRSISDDDLGPETLYDEEHVLASPADKAVRVVDEDEIGGGRGLDEAELAQAGIPPDNGNRAHKKTSTPARPAP